MKLAPQIGFEQLKDESRIEAVVSLARKAHNESRFSYIPFSEEKVRRSAANVISNPNTKAVFLAVKQSKAIGILYCSIGEYHIGSDVLVVTIHNINVVAEERHSLLGGRAALGLFKGVESWAKTRNAKEVFLHVTSGVELARTHKLAKRMGFKFIGGSYAKGM